MGIFLPPKRKGNVFKNNQALRTTVSARKGLNTFLLDNELDPEEVRSANNLRLIGKGILEPRGGTGQYFKSNPGNTVRLITDYLNGSTIELLTAGDDGYLSKMSGNTYTRIPATYSLASGAAIESEQIYGKVYLVDGKNPFGRYDGSTLTSYTKISSPTSLTATKSSGTSGPFTWSWRVSAVSNVGESLASDPVTLSLLPFDFTTTNFVTINWTAASPSSQVTGYIIYGREAGAESYLDSVPANVTSYIDNGAMIPSSAIFPKSSNDTDGPIANHIKRYREKLVLANLLGDTSQFMWSGTGTNIDKFNYKIGGGYYSIEKNSDDRYGLTGIAEKEGKLILFKGFSIYQATIDYNNSLGINEATVSKLVDGVGCISGKTVKQVENSIMFVAYIPGRGLALAKLDYEPNILSAFLRFQPISARVQSIIDQVNFSRVQQTYAVYNDKKYMWFLPIGASSWTCLVYDVERLAFVGPWFSGNSSVGPSAAFSAGVHLDSSNQAHLLFGKSDGNVIEMSDAYSTDEGTDFTWNYLSRNDDFDKPFQLKTILDAKTKLRDVQGGSVSINYITTGKNGLQETSKTVTVTPQNTLAGWGSFPFGGGGLRGAWGHNYSTSKSNSAETVKYTLINKPNILSVQRQISGTGVRAKILSGEIRAIINSVANIPSTWR